MTPAAAPVLSASGLAVSRAGRTVLQGIDLGLAPGELLQVLGANGSGKTTLLRVLCGLASADAGTLQWHGRPLRAADPEFQQALAYLGHANGIDIDLTPAENLRFAARLAGHHADAGQRADSVARALAAQALERVAQVPVRTLSQGQRRRVALARLALAPRALWLLDEPVTALDADSCARFQRQLDAHLSAGGMAVIATHQLLPAGGAVLRLGRPGA
ncbi:heme export protein (ABC superfamily, atp_bind), cytochrome c-type biogenesis [Cupriavidus taiwanensis]|uniref:cytochrome c biogenesis heme-transporting ATPase CcmA n=1 Tax=Cupriavidus taiwanensis TaxID=164546 RepID=UPI000E14C0BD|nr:cytochrome c biogenesis heme-transporting ATPase CcmA [Cupriavidus taiwanensis]SOZ19855.1 heme export protein (ABC superfamily, atp_bind), cytochrome c-type biogenesis [Cupriavidus taiwanensis]SOZ33110.1 heme export protein (ABC superfamily, atp_bind), cytochrome c-type biogenesis [Cupriavidus taiwanensis]SOZ48430.1 heme export protein (ABC superfamily, atp_bind), cytochrome c-type biogenesis [Cupriavidus taiwanensis]